MTIYGGDLIYQTKDEYGKIEVIDHQGMIRSLHFGNQTQQSAMLLSNPFCLIHKYTQAMMIPTCWCYPKNVLVLGLGSGSIVKYLYNYYQDSKIDVVELRSKVIDIAVEYFLLTEDNERIRIYNESTYNWLDKCHTEIKYDLIIIDMFLTSKKGKDITVDATKYISKIKGMLSDNGVATFNCLGDNPCSYPAYSSLSNTFSHNLFTINIESTNAILLAAIGHVPSYISPDTLREYEEKYMLPYRKYFNQINRI